MFKRVLSEKEKLIEELKVLLNKIKTLSGLTLICTNCKKIRVEKGIWKIMETSFQDKPDHFFSHGICPDCEEEIYGDKSWYKKGKNW